MQSIINELNNLINKQGSDVENWFFEKFKEYPQLLNTSTDLRNASYKMAPIDTNIFPAGFNNFNEKSQTLSSYLLKQYLSKHYANCNKILIVPENHTRNLKYIESLVVLKTIIEKAGFIVEVGSDLLLEETQFFSDKKNCLNIQPILKLNGIIQTNNHFIPEVIIINNDMIKGVPDIFKNLKGTQYLVPSVYLGWFNRNKSEHFSIYDEISSEFCKKFGLDPWLISALTLHSDNLNFAKKEGLNLIAEKVDFLIKMIKIKFQEYGILDDPYVFIKANNGTYGMGIMTANRGEDILNINKTNRNKMNKIKGNTVIDSVIIQEGIPSSDLFNKQVAEPLMYYIGADPACHLYRYNSAKDKYSNLNSIGCQFQDVSYTLDNKIKNSWNLVSKLAVLSAAIEAKKLV